MNQKQQQNNHPLPLTALRSKGRSFVGGVVWLALVTVTSLQGQTQSPAVPPSSSNIDATPSSTSAPTPSPVMLPKVLTLAQATSVPLKNQGKTIGTATLPSGTRLQTVREEGDEVVVLHPTMGEYKLPKAAFVETVQAPVSSTEIPKVGAKATPIPGPIAQPAVEKKMAMLKTGQKVSLKGWALWPTIDAKGVVSPNSGFGSGGQVEVLGKANGLVVIRNVRSSTEKIADIAVAPTAFRPEANLANLEEVPIPQHQAEMLANKAMGEAFNTIAIPVSIHTKDKVVKFAIGCAVKISPDQTGTPEWGVKVVIDSKTYLIPKNSLIDAPPSVLSTRSPMSDPAPQITQRTRSQFLEFAKPYYFSDQFNDEVFETGSSVLAEGPAATAVEFGGIPGFKIKEASLGKAGFSTVLPSSFFVENGTGFRVPAVLVLAALSGNGTEQNPFIIRSRNDFDSFCNDPAKWTTGVYTKLETDVDLSDVEFDDSVIAPVFSGAPFDKQPEFNGVFDGNSKKLTGLQIKTKEGATSGLFRKIGKSGVVRNLDLISTRIQGIGSNTQPVAFCYSNEGTIENCKWTGIVEGEKGISVAGLCINNGRSGKIIRCFAGGDGKTKIAGWNNGGICSTNQGLIDRSGSAVEIRGNNSGGLVQQNMGILRECFSGGEITESAYVGGLCDKNYGVIENCISRTTISDLGLKTNEAYIGGLVGSQSTGSDKAVPQILNSVAYGQIKSPVIPGGIVGAIAKKGSPVEGVVEGSFWSIESTGTGQSAGGVGVTSAEMKDQAMFEKSGWDFKTVWRMGENGPELRRAATAAP